MLNFRIETLKLHIVGFSLFGKLSAVNVFHLNLIPFIRQVRGVRILIFANDNFAGILQVFNVLIAHLRGVKDGSNGIDGRIEPAVPDVFDIDDLFKVFPDIHLIKGFRINFRP